MKKFTAGLEFCTKRILYAGKVLLGSRISFNTILKIEPETPLIVTSAVGTKTDFIKLKMVGSVPSLIIVLVKAFL